MEILIIHSSPLDTVDLESIAALPNLDQLRLEDNKLRDDQWARLHGFPKLRGLHLSEIGLTSVALQKLSESLPPDCSLKNVHQINRAGYTSMREIEFMGGRQTTPTNRAR